MSPIFVAEGLILVGRNDRRPDHAGLTFVTVSGAESNPAGRAAGTPVVHQCRQIRGSSPAYVDHENGLVMGFHEPR